MSAPQKYKITAVVGERPWTPTGESAVKTIYYDLDVEGVGKCSLGLPPTDPKPQVGTEVFAILQPAQGNYPPKLVIPKQGGGKGGGGFRGKTPEELAQDRANSAVIRTHEYYLIPAEQRPTLREYLETAGKIDTALRRLSSGQVALEA